MTRYFAPLIAFAVATAFVAHGQILPEFLLQLRDPNVLGGALFGWALKSFGYAFVLAFSGVLAGAAVLLAAWRTRLRGAPDVYAALAAVLAALCLTGSFGVSFAPVGWCCAALFALFLERGGRFGNGAALAVVALWALLQGGAPLAALVAALACAGAWIDARRIDDRVRESALVAAGTLVLGAVQLHAAPWHAYGAHVLYLDALRAGAQRDRLWNGGLSVNMLAFSALLVTAGWYGIRRRGRTADALTVLLLMLLSMLDARNLGYAGVLAAPIVADAVASYYVRERTLPHGPLTAYGAAFAACAFAFIATIISTEPKAVVWPQPPQQPAKLLVALAAHRGHHRVLCEQPRWCDGAAVVFHTIDPLVDDRAGLASSTALRAQSDAVATHGAWRSELAVARVDAIIAKSDANLVALLTQTGWRAVQSDGARVLLLTRRLQ